MAMRTPLRAAVRASRTLEAARTKPCLLSCLPNGTPTVAPFASVHTTSHKAQEVSARHDADGATAPEKEIENETERATEKENETKTKTRWRKVLWPLGVKPSSRESEVEEPLGIEPSSRESEFLILQPRNEASKPRYELATREELLILDDETGNMRPFDAAYLRDRCPCPQCVSPSSGNKSFSTAEIPSDIKIQRLEELPDGAVRIRWLNDIPRAAEADHFSVFPAKGPQSLRAFASEKPLSVISQVPGRVYWNKETLAGHLRRIDYADFVAGGTKFHEGVRALCNTGLLFLTNVPQTETAVADIGLKFGALKETFYGRTWDVISKPEAENVAYTSSYLGLHSDMLYLDGPPRIQLLHCLENSCDGGESIFSDGAHAAIRLRDQDRKDFYRLTNTFVNYHYNKNGFSYHRRRTVIDIGRLRNAPTPEIWWSPPFQAPFTRMDGDAERGNWRHWLKAARAFKDILEDEANVWQYKLQPGECVLFDNLRVLHGRRAFDTGSGRRWLKGTYVADEDFRSTLNNLPQEMSTPEVEEGGVEAAADQQTP